MTAPVPDPVPPLPDPAPESDPGPDTVPDDAHRPVPVPASPSVTPPAMSTATAAPHPIAERALKELDSQAIRTLVREVGLPECPRLLLRFHKELDREEPKIHRLVRELGEDLTVQGHFMRRAHSQLFQLGKPVSTVEQALMVLGLLQSQALLAEIFLHRLVPADNATLARLRDVTAMRARAMTYIARTRRIVPAALAHTTGLFLDIGIPLLARHLPGPDGYLGTLAEASESLEPFTRIERRMHMLDHAVVGAIMARSWGVPQPAVLAVRLSHEYPAWGSGLPPQVCELLGLSLVADHIVARYEEVQRNREWEKAGRLAMSLLGIDERQLFEWAEEVHHHFDSVGPDNLRV